jgi:hypothetical protein
VEDSTKPSDEAFSQEHLLMSDSLSGRFDIGDLETNVHLPVSYGDYVCAFMFDGISIVGELREVLSSDEGMNITFMLAEGEPMGLLQRPTILSQEFLDVAGNRVFYRQYADDASYTLKMISAEAEENFLITLFIKFRQ